MAKPNPKDYIYIDKKGETIVRPAGTIGGYDFLLDGCERCDIRLLDTMAQVQVDYCVDSTIVLGVVTGSVFARNCKNCTIVVACQQLRTRECENCTFFTHVTGQPITEASKGLRFAPLRESLAGKAHYPEFEEQAKKLQSEDGRGFWQAGGSVYDFSHGTSEFRVLDLQEAQPELRKVFPGLAPEVPVSPSLDDPAHLVVLPEATPDFLLTSTKRPAALERLVRDHRVRDRVVVTAYGPGLASLGDFHRAIQLPLASIQTGLRRRRAGGPLVPYATCVLGVDTGNAC